MAVECSAGKKGREEARVLGCGAASGPTFLRALDQACNTHSRQAPGDGQAGLGIAGLGGFLLGAGSL